jgi:hypothetical protein
VWASEETALRRTGYRLIAAEIVEPRLVLNGAAQLLRSRR